MEPVLPKMVMFCFMAQAVVKFVSPFYGTPHRNRSK